MIDRPHLSNVIFEQYCFFHSFSIFCVTVLPLPLPLSLSLFFYSVVVVDFAFLHEIYRCMRVTALLHLTSV